MTAPTDEDWARAFRIAHRPDWAEKTLADLMTAARHVALVQGLAQRLARGQGAALLEHPAAFDDAPPPVRAGDFPPRTSSARANGLTERRRRDDRVDFKRLASGERADDL